MFIQLEHGESIDEKDIIGVFDIDSAGSAESTKEFFKRKGEELGVVSLSNDLPKSFLLCADEYTDRVYITGLSVDSVKKRFDKTLRQF